MAFSTDQIRAIVTDIRSTQISDKEKTLKTKYEEFYNTYPRLFMVAMDPKFPLDYLDMMLMQRDRLSSGLQTVEESDKAVYDVLRERYVTPNLAPTPNQAL
jgi:hypothetical protein